MGKNIKKFISLEDARAQGASGLTSPHIDKISGFTVVNIYSATERTFICSFDDNGYMIFGGQSGNTHPNNEIWYTTTDGNLLATPSITSGATIIDNYKDGDKCILKFSDDVTTVGLNSENMFANFKGSNTLQSIEFPNSVTSIEYVYFFRGGFGVCSNCSGLTSVNLGNSATGLSPYSFAYCPSLTALTLPASMIEIGFLSLTNSGIKTLVVLAENPPTIGENVFGMGGVLPDGLKIYVPDNSVNAYKNATDKGWEAYKNYVYPLSTAKDLSYDIHFEDFGPLLD